MRRTPFVLTVDIEELERTIRTVPDCRLLIIDPLTAYLGATDSHVNAEVRAVLSPLAELAARCNLAVVCISHLRKGDGAAIYRTSGSLAFVAAPRAAWAVTRDADDPTGRRRLFLPIKCNLAPNMDGLAYTLEPAPNGTAVICWGAERVRKSIDEAMASLHRRPGPEPEERREAASWLLELLAGGRMAVDAVRSEGKAAGFSWATLKRAKSEAGAVSRKGDFGEGWFWTLPDEGAQSPPVQRTCAPSVEPEPLRVSEAPDEETQDKTDETPFLIALDEGAQDVRIRGNVSPLGTTVDDRVPPGWTREGWVGELRRKADRCHATDAKTSALYRQAADELEGGKAGTA